MTTPMTWRKEWALYRSKRGTDSRGDPVRTYDMEHPDHVGESSGSSGVCWRIGSDSASTEAYGERQTATASFVLYDSVEIAPHDRCVFGGRLWEVKAVTPKLRHREVRLEEVSAWT